MENGKATDGRTGNVIGFGFQVQVQFRAACLYVCPLWQCGKGRGTGREGGALAMSATGFCFSLRAAAQSSELTTPRSTLN